MTVFTIHPAVADALRSKQPVVALESTIITHGMPYPQNLETARAVETVVRAEQATPATIAVIKGKLHIGLADDQLAWLAEQTDVLKLSSADLAYAVSSGKTGSTTVAATMIAADRAGIKVFATGGIGGVHKGAEQSFDISADLPELARSRVIVVSAGPKAILDGEKTLEVLETLGVPVVTFGADLLPAFWSRESTLQTPLRLDRVEDIAGFAATRAALGQAGGMLITNPVPPEYEIPAAIMRGHIEIANREARESGITGKAVTPWLLSRIVELTGGASLETNIHLVRNNARLAAQIARAMVKSEI